MDEKNNTFMTGAVPKKDFSLIEDSTYPTGYQGGFILKKGKSPSEALETIRKGLTLTGCGEVCQIAHYEALLSVLGKEKFNALFAADSPTPLRIDAVNMKNPIYRLFQNTKIDGKPIEKGTQYHFTNSRLYIMKHPTGEARGINVLCVDDTPGKEKFIGLGLDPKGETSAQIAKRLFEEYNKSPIAFELVSRDLKIKLLRRYTPEVLAYMKKLGFCIYQRLEDFNGDGGGKCRNEILNYDIASISILKNESTENARKTFTKWAQEWDASRPKITHTIMYV
jgi:hypothetical protein